MGLWEDLETESRKPGPTMTITKAQYSALVERNRLAYTLLCSSEPALIRGVAQAPNPTSLYYQRILLEKVKEWIASHRLGSGSGSGDVTGGSGS
jgi:hypothetical protein